MELLNLLNRAQSLLLQGQYEGAEHLIDRAIDELKNSSGQPVLPGTVAELIEKLKEKDQSAVVEFVIAKENGEIVCAQVSKTAKDMVAMLKMFK